MGLRVEVRKASAEDVPQIVEFTRNTYPWGDYVPRAIDEWVRLGTAYVAVEGQRVLGVVNMELLPTGVAWLEGIRVRPDSRRRGIGTLLTEHVLSVASSLGFTHAMLMVAEWNEPSKGLVSKLGFKPVMKVYAGVAGPTGARRVTDPAERRNLVERALSETKGYLCFRWVCTRATVDYAMQKVKDVIVGPGIGLDDFSVGRPTSLEEREVLATEPEGFKENRGAYIVYEKGLS